MSVEDFGNRKNTEPPQSSVPKEPGREEVAPPPEVPPYRMPLFEWEQTADGLAALRQRLGPLMPGATEKAVAAVCRFVWTAEGILVPGQEEGGRHYLVRIERNEEPIRLPEGQEFYTPRAISFEQPNLRPDDFKGATGVDERVAAALMELYVNAYQTGEYQLAPTEPLTPDEPEA